MFNISLGEISFENVVNDDISLSLIGQATTSIPVDYIAYWKFDNSLVDEGGNYNANNAGGVTYTTGLYDRGCADFDSGSSDYLYANITQNQLDTGITIGGRFNIDTFSKSSNDFRLLMSPSTSNLAGIALDQDVEHPVGESGCLRIGLSIDNLAVDPWEKTIDLNLVTDTWYHLALTYNENTNRLKFYVDGNKKADFDIRPYSKEQTITLDSSWNVQGVAIDSSNNIYSAMVDGQNPHHSKLFKYNSSGTLLMSNEHADSGHIGDIEIVGDYIYAPFAYPIFDDPGENDQTDFGIYRYKTSDLTLDTSWEDNGKKSLGEISYAGLSFVNASKNYITNEVDVGGNQKMTLYIRFKPSSSGSNTQVIAGLQDLTQPRYHLLILRQAGGDMKVYFNDNDDSDWFTNVFSGYFTSRWNTWCTLTLVYDNGNCYVYNESGLLDSWTSTETGESGTLDTETNYLFVGADRVANYGFFEGQVQSTALWKGSALSASEISEFNGNDSFDLTTNSGDYVSSSNLHTWWRMRESISSTGGIIDHSGNGNHGTSYSGGFGGSPDYDLGTPTALTLNTTTSEPSWMDSSLSAVCWDGSYWYALLYSNNIIKFDSDFNYISTHRINFDTVKVIGSGEYGYIEKVGDGIVFDTNSKKFIITTHGDIIFYLNQNLDSNTLVASRIMDDTSWVCTDGQGVAYIQTVSGNEEFWLAHRTGGYPHKLDKLRRKSISGDYSINNFNFMRFAGGKGVTMDFFDGQIQDAFVYPRALNSDEIYKLNNYKS